MAVQQLPQRSRPAHPLHNQLLRFMLPPHRKQVMHWSSIAMAACSPPSRLAVPQHPTSHPCSPAGKLHSRRCVLLSIHVSLEANCPDSGNAHKAALVLAANSCRDLHWSALS